MFDMRFCMDWRTVQFDWNRARAFLVTAEEGSLSAAARALGTTQPTVGRQVTALEEELGVVLFERVGTSLEPTEAALSLLEHVRAMGEAATRMSLVAAGHTDEISGPVSITASEAISAFMLPRVVARIRQEYPGVELELVVSNDARDLQRREADIAIRNFQPTQPELYARKLGESAAHLYAAPAYVERAGPFETAQDFANVEIFAFDRSNLMVDALKALLGLETGAHNYPIVTSNHLVQWELCKRGVGICVMMKDVGDAEPRVQKLLEDRSIPIPIWLVAHRELRTNRRIKLVFDLIADALLTGP